jgi:CHAT domain-containing protein/Tfp pilus assembly protein PilF
MPLKIRRLSWVVLITLFLQTLAYDQEVRRPSSPLLPADEASLRAALDQYLAAYAREDLEACVRLWSVNSPNLASRKDTLDKLFKANEGISIKNTTIHKVSADAERATVRLGVEVSAVDAKTKKTAGGFGRLNRELQFVKENGDWKIWSDVAAEETFATALITAESREERDALWAAEKELMTAELWRALTRHGARQHSLSNYPQALMINQLSLSVAERIADKEGMGQAMNDLGVVHYSQGNYTRALAYLRKSLMLRNEVGDKLKIAISLTNLGTVYGSRGNYSLAAEHYRKALEQFEAVGHTVGIGVALNNLGNTYEAQGNYSLANNNYERALKHFEALGDSARAAASLNNLGIVYQKQGNSAAALDYMQKGLKIKEGLNDKFSIALSLQNIGDLLRSEGKYDLALSYLQKSRAQFEAIGENARGYALCLGAIAIVYHLKGDYTKALEFAERATTIASQIEGRDVIWETRTTAGRAYRALNQPVQARKAFEEAIATIEGLRAWVAGGEQEQQRFFENKITPYHELIALLIDQGNPAEALGYAEQAKARVLLDVLRRGKVDVTKTMTPKEQEQETKLKSDLISLNTQMARERQQPQPNQGRLAGLQAQLDKARLEYEAFQTSLYTAHPDLKARRGEVRSATPQEVTALLPEAGSALIEYVVTEQKTYLFVATKEVGAKSGTLSWKAHTIDVKRKDLADQVESFRLQLAKRDLTFREYAGRLYDLLLKPLEPELNGKHTLVIVPDGPLWELPFQALQHSQRRYLVEDHAISYAPSLTVLREMAKLRPKVTGAAESRTLLAFGNPALSGKAIESVQVGYRDERLMPLPEAEREVKALAQLYGEARSTIYIGLDAREERLKAEAKTHRILQLAAHALLNDVNPMYSHVLLAQGAQDAKDDGLLEAWEMMNLDLRADLVVLSACETGRGRVAAGEGVIGMTWALFVAGSPTTVVSLWKVESLSTTELMLEFHRNLLSGRGTQGSRPSKAAALQRAAIRMLKTKDSGHPFYWAGFSVVGDGN